jgi:threonine dehydrogenase-like Zn-dependent dehydrogenase
VSISDIDASRADIAKAMGARFAAPHDCPGDQDVVIHTSASEAGLALSLAKAGFEARVVEASWFGSQSPRVPLGEAFHARRLQFISSQVGSVATPQRARYTYARRLATALDLLKDPRADRLITTEIPFTEAPQMLPAVLSDGSTGLGTVLRY